MANARKGRKSSTGKPQRKRGTSSRGGGERKQLVKRIAQALRIGEAEAELRALRELAERVAPQQPVPEPSRSAGPLPERLYLLLDGRGLDGRGMPVEVIDSAVVGSGRLCTVWVNSPRIETRHLQVTRENGEWFLEDLGSEHGTFLGDERVKRRRVQHGEEYRLAGYLRLRTELR